MIPPKRLTTALATLAIVALGLVAAAPADTLKVPKASPVFVLDLPDGWTHTADKDGDITCEPATKDGYSFQVIATSDVTTKADMKEALPQLAKAIAAKSKLTDLEVGDIEDSTNGNKVPFTGLRADAKSGNTALVIILHAFEPKKGKWYVILTVGTEETDKAHEDDYTAIYDSIQTLK